MNALPVCAASVCANVSTACGRFVDCRRAEWRRTPSELFHQIFLVERRFGEVLVLLFGAGVHDERDAFGLEPPERFERGLAAEVEIRRSEAVLLPLDLVDAVDRRGAQRPSKARAAAGASAPRKPQSRRRSNSFSSLDTSLL